MPSLDQQPQGWDPIVDAYDRYIAPFTGEYAADALQLAAIKPGERVLDVAAGSGALSLLAARAGARVLATDFAPAMVERLAKRAAAEKVAIEAAVMDGQALDVEPATFDAAFSMFGLMFFPDRAKGYAGLHRALKPGGRAVVAGWSGPEKSQMFQHFGRAMKEVAPELPPSPAPPAALSLSEPGKLERELAAAGFRDVALHLVEHTLAYPDGKTAWYSMAEQNPVFPQMIKAIGEARVPALREALLRPFGDGPVSFRAEARIGIGWR